MVYLRIRMPARISDYNFVAALTRNAQFDPLFNRQVPKQCGINLLAKTVQAILLRVVNYFCNSLLPTPSTLPTILNISN